MKEEKLYKISGTGWFFHDFYVEAISEIHAKARATDILFAEHRAKSGKWPRKKSGKWPRKSALDQIQRVEEVPSPEVKLLVLV